MRYDHSLYSITHLLLEAFGGTYETVSAQENDYREHAI